MNNVHTTFCTQTFFCFVSFCFSYENGYIKQRIEYYTARLLKINSNTRMHNAYTRTDRRLKTICAFHISHIRFNNNNATFVLSLFVVLFSIGHRFRMNREKELEKFQNGTKFSESKHAPHSQLLFVRGFCIYVYI